VTGLGRATDELERTSALADVPDANDPDPECDETLLREIEAAMEG
jgi:hypothetical protein